MSPWRLARVESIARSGVGVPFERAPLAGRQPFVAGLEACSRVGNRPAESSGEGLWPRSRGVEAASKPLLVVSGELRRVLVASRWPAPSSRSGSTSFERP